MLWIFWHHTIPHLRRSPGLTLLNIFGISLGIAVFVSIQIANESSLRAFQSTIDVVAGKSDVEIVSAEGRFDESVFRSLRGIDGVEALTPTLEEVCAIAPDPAHPQTRIEAHSLSYIRILGIDVFSNIPFRPLTLQKGSVTPAQDADPADFFRRPNAIAISEKLSQKLGVRVGQDLHLLVGQEIRPFRVVALLRLDDSTPGADDRLAVMDLANMQEIFGLTGRLNRIDIRLEDALRTTQWNSHLARTLGQIRQRVPDHLDVQPPDRRGSQIQNMLAAFRLNLTALSLLSLMVGMFLIFNSVTTAVVRRRREIGILRALGMTRLQIRMMFLVEALAMGAAGILAGWLGGCLLAKVILGSVARTISSVYLLVSVDHLWIPVWLLPASLLLGLGAVAVAALYPAHEASQVHPVEALSHGNLQDKTVRASHRLFWAGVAVAVSTAGLGFLALHFFPPLGFVAALSLVLGIALMCPQVTRLCCQGGTRLLSGTRFYMALLSLKHLGQSLNRVSVAVAALMSAFAMTIGVTIMIHSFRTTVTSWVNQSIRADLVIAPSSQLRLGARATLDPAFLDSLGKMPEVKSVDFYQEIRPLFRGEITKIAVSDLRNMPVQRNLEFEGGDFGDICRRLVDGENVVVSDTFLRKFRVRIGDCLDFRSPRGPARFTIVGSFRDFSSEGGMILMDRHLFARYWEKFTPQTVALYLKDPTRTEEVRNRLAEGFSSRGELLVLANKSVKSQILQIFDQTFAVTYVLRTIAVLVSILAIFQTLTVLVTERARHIGILRATGATRGQIRRIIYGEAAFIGLLGSVLGLAGGFILAYVLNNVINLAFFRWTILWATPWPVLWQTPLLVIGCSLLAAWGPARRASTMSIAGVMKSE
ncbi:MAG: FtsX-like permease family protein [Verrucomicrobiae bacterium]|nr:FtsX-like permease family protein [Verrucomicrobiae bacterium]